MRWYKQAAFCLLGLLVAFFPTNLYAAENPKNHGLYISPLRSYVSVQPDNPVIRALTVANLTEKSIVVTLSIEQFSIANDAYDYRFSKPDNNWVQFVENRIELKPNESREVAYRISVPKGAPGGGEYYTLIASANLSEAGLSGTVRAASLLYLTVDGSLIRTSELKQAKLFPIVIAPEISYTLDVKNTGNVHYFAYFSAEIEGLRYRADPTGLSQLLMPGTTRHTKSTIAAPRMPGFYRVTYGYTPDSGSRVQTSQLILFIPPWFLIFLGVTAIIVIGVIRRRRSNKQSLSSTDS